MAEVAGLLGGLRGLTPPAEPFHPAVARRKLREDMRALANGADTGNGSREAGDGSSDPADTSHDSAPGAGTPDS
jgi:hypothetical protein